MRVAVVACLLLVTLTVCHAEDEQSRINTAAWNRQVHGLRASEDTTSHPSTWGVGVAGADVKSLWTITDDVIGKVSDVEINGPQGVVVFGTTFLPLTLVSVVDIVTGQVKSKASPSGAEASFVYAVESSADGKYLAVMGSPLQGSVSTVWMYPNFDLTAKPTWTYAFNGTVFWGSRSMKMSDDAGYIGIGALWQRPQFVGPTPGHTLTLDAKTGRPLGDRYVPLTMGEVWIDEEKGARQGFRSFNDTEGNFTTLGVPKLDIKSNVLDKYNGITVSSAVTHVLVPKDTDVQTIETFNTDTGAREWYYTAAAGEELYGLVLGKSTAVVLWWSTPAAGFQVRVFSLTQPAQLAVAKASFVIPLATKPDSMFGPLLALGGTADDRDVFVAIPGVGVYYANPVASPTPVPSLIYSYPDTCAFLTLTAARVATGAVIIAGLNERVSSTTCQEAASVWAGIIV